MKEEIVDDEYERAANRKKRAAENDDDESMMVAKRIKQELGMDDEEPQEIIVRRIVREAPPPPIVFDHFICMRIGLNSENNVQKLMALLSAHNFVDLTVIPGPPIMPSIIAAPPSAAAMIQFAEPSSSRPVREEVEPPRPPPKKYAPRRQPGDNLPGIPTLLKCTKCHEVMGTGATCNSILAHVQKFHLKMAAFQCRICKHYRTTQERIQSHVTTVHKARSTTFDDALAGPISVGDMALMEKMINTCFPEITVWLVDITPVVEFIGYDGNIIQRYDQFGTKKCQSNASFSSIPILLPELAVSVNIYICDGAKPIPVAIGLMELGGKGTEGYVPLRPSGGSDEKES